MTENETRCCFVCAGWRVWRRVWEPLGTMRLLPHQVALSILSVLLSTSASLAQSPDRISPVAPQGTPAGNESPHKAKTAHSRKKKRRKVLTADGSKKVVVHHGGTTEPLSQIAPGKQESSERRKSGQLLTATGANLKSLGDKKLTPDQQATVTQIRQFMEQSRAALDAGDLTQGYNLASKANVLSEELKK